MDKRIEKTKHMIKSAMLNLMKKKSFNKITVKEICDNAFTSRITFYTYYENKNELVEDIAADIKDEIMTHYEQLQIKNNASNKVEKENVVNVNNWGEIYKYLMLNKGE